MDDVEKKKDVAAALCRLTNRGELTWEEFDADDEVLPDDLEAPEGGSVFTAIYEGMDLFLYEEEEGSTALRVVEPESGIGWTFPELDALDELYEQVEFRAYGLEEWMDTVLANAGFDDAEEEESEASFSEGDGEAAEASTDEELREESVSEMEGQMDTDPMDTDPTEGDEETGGVGADEDEVGLGGGDEDSDEGEEIGIL